MIKFHELAQGNLLCLRASGNETKAIKIRIRDDTADNLGNRNLVTFV